jgi:hypothetical protein
MSGETSEIDIRGMTELEDVNIAAYFKLKGYPVKTFRCVEEPHRILFVIDGMHDAKIKTMREFYDNDKIGINDYLKCLKDLKSEMHTMKRFGKS